MIKALEKAEGIAQLQKHAGAPMSDFAVVLTVKEGFELIDWFLTQEMLPVNIQQLASDVALARTAKDPWIVLNHFHLRGFPIIRKSRRH